MRISTSAMTKMLTNQMNGAYGTYADILQKIASNRNFTRMSENPTDGSKLLKLKDQLAQMDEYQSNIQAAINEMDLAYDTLDAVTGELSNISNLIVEAANGTTTPDSAKAIAESIKEKVGIISDKMNTKYLDNFIFAGTYVQQMPYVEDEDGNITYKGSSQATGDRNLTISEGKTFTYNLTGEQIFGVQDGKNDFFSQMRELDELLNEDPLNHDAIRSKLAVLEDATKNITQANGIISADVTKLVATQEINNDTITKLTEDRVDIEEVDITQAAIELSNAQAALQASYIVGTNLLGSVSLLDYI